MAQCSLQRYQGPRPRFLKLASSDLFLTLDTESLTSWMIEKDVKRFIKKSLTKGAFKPIWLNESALGSATKASTDAWPTWIYDIASPTVDEVTGDEELSEGREVLKIKWQLVSSDSKGGPKRLLHLDPFQRLHFCLSVVWRSQCRVKRFMSNWELRGHRSSCKKIGHESICYRIRIQILKGYWKIGKYPMLSCC